MDVCHAEEQRNFYSVISAPIFHLLAVRFALIYFRLFFLFFFIFLFFQKASDLSELDVCLFHFLSNHFIWSIAQMFVNTNSSPANQKAGNPCMHACRCGEYNLLKFMASIRVRN